MPRAKIVTNGRHPNFQNSQSFIAPCDLIDPKWPDWGWSLVVNNLNEDHTEGDVEFLSPHGPKELLVSGTKFRLIDGKNTYISGEIL